MNNIERIPVLEKENLNRDAVVVTNGKFNPPTRAHEKMIQNLFERAAVLRQKGYNSIVMIFSPSKDSKQNNNIVKRKNIILFDDERKHMLETICDILSNMYGGIPFEIHINNFYVARSSFFSAVSENRLGFLNIVVGSDRVDSFRSQNKILTSGFGDNRNETPVNRLANNAETPPYSILDSQVSSSLFRELIKRQNYDFAHSILAKHLTDEQKTYIVEKAADINRKVNISVMEKIKKKQTKSGKKYTKKNMKRRSQNSVRIYSRGRKKKLSSSN